MIILLLVLVNVVLLEQGYVSGSQWYKPVLVTLPLLLIAVVLRWRKII